MRTMGRVLMVAIVIAALHSLAMSLMFCVSELLNGARDWQMIMATPLFWYFYWFPWQPAFLIALLSIWLMATKPTFWTLPIATVVCAIAGAFTPEKNLAVFFGVSTDPIIFVGFGWWSLIAGFAISPVLMWLARAGKSESKSSALVS